MVSMVAKEETSVMERVKSDGEVLLGSAGDEEEEDDVMLPGYRFHPTDEELVTFYLRRKVARKGLRIEVIREMDIYKHDPWDLPKASTVGGEKEWYFFCLRGRKYRNSIRPNRVTGSGFWKATGIDRPIYPAATGNSGESIGLKKSLVYYRGSAGKGTKTDWMMHEFRLPPATAATNASPSMQEAEVWTICRIFRRTITYRKQHQQPQQLAWRPAPAMSTTVVAESSSNTGSFESSEGGDEYMNCLAPAPAPAAPCIPQQQQHTNQMGTANNVHLFYRDAMQNQQFQGQWDTLPAAPMPEQKPVNNPLSMTAAFHQNEHGLATATTNDFYKVEGYLEEIARMMEVNDPVAFYDYRSYA